MTDHYINILNIIASGENKLIRDISLLSSEEYKKIIFDWNKTEIYYEKEKTIIEVFEEITETFPEKIALVFENEKLTYKELNGRANKLAHTIRRDYKDYFGSEIKKDTLIGLFMGRSADMIVSILAILKSGAAYVPFDLADPEERLKFKINDCGCKLILTSSDCLSELVFLAETDTIPIAVDEYKDEIEKLPLTNPAHINKAHDLAYVIYTSGSTGKPKGVMIEHYGVINLISSHRKSFNINEDSVILQIAPISFDASVSTLFCALLNGAKLCFCTEEVRKDVNKLSEFIVREKITFIDIPAKLFELLPEDLDTTHLKYVITAGEVCNKKTMDYWCDKLNVLNAYGPTEATVCTTFSLYSEDKSNRNIGKPIGNKKVYVLDSNGNPLPSGIAGELYIGGDGLARGYLNRPSITEERFIENNFSRDGSRIYKTGDMVRWIKDGSLEFTGRNDDQVKIHGYRIEPGEIENKLSLLEGITLCAVTVYKREENKYLCAYYSLSKELSRDEIKDHLERHLPDYMIPAYYIEMENLPFNTSGKIDKKALPAPGLKGVSENYIPPSNETEEKLCKIWEGILGIEKVGINDDFFRIGGDSILSIQLSSSLKNEGFNFAVKDIFKYPTVSKLAEYLLSSGNEKVEIISEKGLLEGEFDLLPIQSWFFHKVRKGELPDYNHWNQSFMLKVPELDLKKVKKAVLSLVSFHDMLRATFKEGRQKYNREIEIPELKLLDRSNLSDEELYKTLTDWQSVYNIENGPLWQTGYIYGYDDKKGRLYFSLHHLIVDAVSWRILIEDFKKAYEGEELKEKTSSYRQWVNTIKAYPKNHHEEKDYWEKTVQSLPDYGILRDKTLKPVSTNFALSKEMTGKLIKEANEAYSTGINDLLLTALASALKDLEGSSIQGITLEGHGRENIDPSIDHSRTLGWFTSVCPVKLELREDMESTILSIKNNLRRIPNNGVGWGAFCYSSDEDLSHSLIKHESLPPVSFNYLGQMDSAGKGKEWHFAGEKSGESSGANNQDKSLIALNGLVINEELKFGIHSLLGEEKTERFTQIFKAKLIEIINHCMEVKKKGTGEHFDRDRFEYIPYILLNQNGSSDKLVIMVHPDSGYEAYMATLYPLLSSEIKVILIDNFYQKVYLKDGVIFEKYEINHFKDLAEYYVKLLLSEEKELLSCSEVSLLGYSFGSPVACEMDRIFREQSIKVDSLFLIDPLIPTLLKTHKDLKCFKWYKDYIPAPTPTRVVHFRCTVPDSSLPDYAEYFIDPETSSLSSIAKNLEEINIEACHTKILDNRDFLRIYEEKSRDYYNIEDKKEKKRKREELTGPEKKIKEILCEILKRDDEENFDINENIFHMGITSIQSLSLLAMINENYNISLSVSDILHNFTIKGILSAIINSQKSKEDEQWKPLLFKGKEDDNLYFFPGLIGSAGSYGKVINSLSEIFNVIFFEPKGMYGTMVPFGSYEETISSYVNEIIKQNDKNSAVFLAGHSVGSIHSLDAAIILEEKGFTDINLINIDGYLHKINSVEESIGCKNLDSALLNTIKFFFYKGQKGEKGSEALKKDPLQEMASILFPYENVSRDYALRVALGYRNIWHKQLNEMLKYKEPSEKFKGNVLLFITKEPDKEMQNNILKSSEDRYKNTFEVKYVSGDHLTCITIEKNIQELYKYILEWKKSINKKINKEKEKY